MKKSHSHVGRRKSGRAGPALLFLALLLGVVFAWKVTHEIERAVAPDEIRRVGGA